MRPLPQRIPPMLGAATAYLLAAAMQFGLLVHDRPAEGTWLLFGTDTVAHDAPVQLHVWQPLARGGRLPLWMPELKAGLPTVGAFLWTPLAPTLWAHAALPFPHAQRLQFLLAAWWAALGGYLLARRLGLRESVAFLVGAGIGFSGHLVTLAHAGHLQKVLALAWLPWFAAGAVQAFAAAGARETLRGAALAALALGMALLAGHPQIAYIMLMMLLARMAFAGRWKGGRWRRTVPVAAAIAAFGLALGAAQLLPGMEMARESNRAAGVAWEEAVATSYPPSEVWEFVLPRFRGDSSAVGHGEYIGHWGERLVSDYAGVAIVVLALLAWGRRARRAEAAFWWIVVALSLVVGFGKHTPLYRVLYEAWPGMRSFRSPGTFFAAAAMALPVLAGFGLEAFLAWRAARPRWLHTAMAVALIAALVLCAAAVWTATGDPLRRAPEDIFFWHALRRSAAFAVVLALLAAAAVAWRDIGPRREAALALLFALLALGDLMPANAAFLRAVPWDDYSAYVAPNALDAWASDLPEPRRIFEPGRELSLRPILNGRDALLGYHPISYQLYEDRLVETELGSAAWRAQWGVAHVWVAQPHDDLPDSLSVAARLRDAPGGVVLRDARVPPPVRMASGEAMRLEYTRGVNTAMLEAELEQPGTVEVVETLAPGWKWRVDGGEWMHATTVHLTRRVDVPAGAHRVEWRYEPASFRLGLFAMALAAALLAAVAAATARPRPVRGCSESAAAQPSADSVSPRL